MLAINNNISLRWDTVPGNITGWEIKQINPDGTVVKSTAGSRARTTTIKLPVEGKKIVTVIDLPNRNYEQLIELVID